MKNNIKEIFYIKKGSFKQSEYLKIEILENKNLIKYSLNNLSKVIEVNDEKIDIFIERLWRTTINWKEQYINKNFIDGNTWQLKIIFKDNSIKNYLGKNCFPENFENFNKIKNELLK